MSVFEYNFSISSYQKKKKVFPSILWWKPISLCGTKICIKLHFYSGLFQTNAISFMVELPVVLTIMLSILLLYYMINVHINVMQRHWASLWWKITFLNGCTCFDYLRSTKPLFWRFVFPAIFLLIDWLIDWLNMLFEILTQPLVWLIFSYESSKNTHILHGHGLIIWHGRCFKVILARLCLTGGYKSKSPKRKANVKSMFKHNPKNSFRSHKMVLFNNFF